MIAVSAFHPSGKHSPPETGVCDHRHLMFCVPAACIFLRRSGDGYTSAAPGIPHLLSESVIRARYRERDQIIFVCVFIGLLNPLMCPVGAAENADFSLCVHGVENLDDRSGRNFRIIAMQQIDVDIIRLQIFERLPEICPHVLFIHALPAVRVRMSALRQHHHLIPVIPQCHPFAQRFLRELVHSRRIIRRDAEVIHSVKQLVRILTCKKRHGRRPVKNPRNRLADAGNSSVLHSDCLPQKNLYYCEIHFYLTILPAICRYNLTNGG